MTIMEETTTIKEGTITINDNQEGNKGGDDND